MRRDVTAKCFGATSPERDVAREVESRQKEECVGSASWIASKAFIAVLEIDRRSLNGRILEGDMVLNITPRKRIPDYKSAAIGFAKAIVSAIPAAFSPDPVTGLKSAGASLNNLVDAILALGKDTSDQLDFTAYDVINAAFAAGLSIFMTRINLSETANEAELDLIVAHQIEVARILLFEADQSVAIAAVESPLLLRPFRDAATNIVPEILRISSKHSPAHLRKEFESAMFDGFKSVWISKPALFTQMEQSLTGHFAELIDKRKAKAFHQRSVIKAFSQDPIFGQEDTGITVSNLYVRQRCLWSKSEIISSTDGNNNAKLLGNTQTKDRKFNASYKAKVSRLYLTWLHDSITKWLGDRDARDAVRVVAGGPGSGKSTFAKAIMVETFDDGQYDVLFIPLQEIEPSGSFEARIAQLFRTRTDLGFDNVDSPLSWMAQSKPDGQAPMKPLLLICDGLDEIAPPETAEAINVTTDFIQALRVWIHARNANGCYVKAIILGRDIAAREAFGRLGIDEEALLTVAGLRPIIHTVQWKEKAQAGLISDVEELAAIDQRITYWEKWAAIKGANPRETPEPLKSDREENESIQDLTAEPLLLYLLLWTGYLGDNWREAADNRNVVYREIFQRIYARDWGDGRSASPAGGHTGTRLMSLECFLELQEALGLSSWPSGGRIISSNIFDKIKKIYLDRDLQDDLKNNSHFSLKNIALQSYARNVEGDNSSYEFVHKSLSEYLISRALYMICFKGLTHLAQRISDDRAHDAAAAIAHVAYLGPLTKEINRFFLDEIRLQCSESHDLCDRLLLQGKALLDWLLVNMAPMHEIKLIYESANFQLFDQADRRFTDVVWSLTQHLASIKYKFDEFESDGGWSSGPLKIKWPSHNRLTSLVSRLSDRAHVAETSRFCTFNFLDCTNQVLTEVSLGSVIFETRDAAVVPDTWCAFKAVGSVFENAAFYAANLWQADFSYSVVQGCSFHSSIMQDFSAISAKFFDCHFDSADLSESCFSNAGLYHCSFDGTSLKTANLSNASIVECDFSTSSALMRSRRRVRTGTLLLETDFSESVIEKTSFDRTAIESCNFERAIFDEVQFRESILDECNLDSVTAKKILVLQSQLETEPFRTAFGINLEVERDPMPEEFETAHDPSLEEEDEVTDR